MAKTGAPGIEPHEMSLPAMDRPSVVFAWFLDSITVTSDASGATPPTAQYLECTACSEWLCEVSDGDSLRVLFNTVLAHTC